MGSVPPKRLQPGYKEYANHGFGGLIAAGIASQHGKGSKQDEKARKKLGIDPYSPPSVTEAHQAAAPQGAIASSSVKANATTLTKAKAAPVSGAAPDQSSGAKPGLVATEKTSNKTLLGG